MMNSRGKDFEAKQEGDDDVNNDTNKLYSSKTTTASTSSSRQWAGFRNPRIVRVSRSFGGKDRHSKVCTVRGLKDRRIRLSVPTAIQLYDLQDRLGLTQPSKVVDWLLDATKTEIDKLPPLQMLPGNLSLHHQFHHPFALNSHHSSPPTSSSTTLPHFFSSAAAANPSMGGAQPFFSPGKQGIIRINDGHIHHDGNDQMRYWNQDSSASNRKEAERRDQATAGGGGGGGKDKWIIASNDDDHHQENREEEGMEGYAAQLTAQNFFPIGNIQPSFPSLLSSALPYNPFYHWEASNLSLSQLSSHSNNIPIQTEDSNTHNSASLASSMPPLPSGSQLYFCPSAATVPTIVPSLLPSYMASSSSLENDPRQINHFQFLSSSSHHHHHVQPNSLMPTLHLISSPLKSLTLNVNPKTLHSQENDHNHPNKGGN